MRVHEFIGKVDGWPAARGKNVSSAVLNALNEYDGHFNSATVRVYIVPKKGLPFGSIDHFINIRAMWVEESQGWMVTEVK
jgi:hypothetical protein